jgi:hypothetical protein
MVAATPFFVLFIAAIMVFFINFKKQSLNSWFFAVVTAIFFVLTLKSQRYVEYFIPLAVGFSALSLNVIFDSTKKRLSQLLSPGLVLILPLLVLFAISPLIYRDLKAIKDTYQQKGFGFNQFTLSSQWLADHSSPGDIVFQTDWDQFPLLFYHNDKNYYLVGLDPTFMYVYDPDIFQRWLDLVLDQGNLDLYQNIKTVFGAKYVFIDLKKNQAFDRNLAGNFYFKKIYQDQEAKIYQVLND